MNTAKNGTVAAVASALSPNPVRSPRAFSAEAVVDRFVSLATSIPRRPFSSPRATCVGEAIGQSNVLPVKR